MTVDWQRLLKQHADDGLWALILLDWIGKEFGKQSLDAKQRLIGQTFTTLARHAQNKVAFHRAAMYVAMSVFKDDRDRVLAVCSALQERIVSDVTPGDAAKHFDEVGWRVTVGANSQIRAALPVQTAPPKNVVGEDLDRIVAEALREYSDRGVLKAPPPHYFGHFEDSAREKADVFVSEAADRQFNLGDSVVISIGGGDGAELSTILLQSSAKYGILVELNPDAVEHARTRNENLQRAGKVMEIVPGDAMQMSPFVRQKVEDLRANRAIRSVAVTIHAMLHELPSRSPGYEPQRLVHNLLYDMDSAFVFIREPTAASDWPTLVQLKVAGLAAERLCRLAATVSEHCRVDTNVQPEVISGRVRMTNAQAIETLFKLFYIQDFRYEMGETITSFIPHEFSGMLEQALPGARVDLNYVESGSFKKKYRDYGVQTFDDKSGKENAHPNCFCVLEALRKPT